VVDTQPVDTKVTVMVYVPGPKVDIVACPLAVVVTATAADPFIE